VVIGGLDASEVANIVGRDREKRTDLLRELLHGLTPEQISVVVIEALNDDNAAKEVANKIAVTISLPKAERRYRRIDGAPQLGAQ
jgi:hypothetical protein